MERLDREALLKKVVRALVEEGGQATTARLYYKLHNEIDLPYWKFVEEVKKSGKFVVTQPAGWENDLVSLKPLEPDRRLEKVEGGRAEPLRVALTHGGGAGKGNEGKH